MYTSVAFKQKKISLLALFLVPKQLLQSFSPTTVEVPLPLYKENTMMKRQTWFLNFYSFIDSHLWSSWNSWWLVHQNFFTSVVANQKYMYVLWETLHMYLYRRQTIIIDLASSLCIYLSLYLETDNRRKWHIWLWESPLADEIRADLITGILTLGETKISIYH